MAAPPRLALRAKCAADLLPSILSYAVAESSGKGGKHLPVGRIRRAKQPLSKLESLFGRFKLAGNYGDSALIPLLSCLIIGRLRSAERVTRAVFALG